MDDVKPPYTRPAHLDKLRRSPGRPVGGSKYVAMLEEMRRPATIDEIMERLDGIMMCPPTRAAAYYGIYKLIQKNQIEKRGNRYALPGQFEKEILDAED